MIDSNTDVRKTLTLSLHPSFQSVCFGADVARTARTPSTVLMKESLSEVGRNHQHLLKHFDFVSYVLEEIVLQPGICCEILEQILTLFFISDCCLCISTLDEVEENRLTYFS